MKNLLLLSLIVLFATTVSGQQVPENESFTLHTKQYNSLEVLQFPKGLNVYEYNTFSLDQPIIQNVNFQIDLTYNEYISSQLLNSSYTLKWYLNNKTYLFAGLRNEYQTDLVSGRAYLIRSDLDIGVGYDVNPDVLLEMGYHQQKDHTDEEFEIHKKDKKGFSLRAKF